MHSVRHNQLWATIRFKGCHYFGLAGIDHIGYCVQSLGRKNATPPILKRLQAYSKASWLTLRDALSPGVVRE